MYITMFIYRMVKGRGDVDEGFMDNYALQDRVLSQYHPSPPRRRHLFGQDKAVASEKSVDQDYLSARVD